MTRLYLSLAGFLAIGFVATLTANLAYIGPIGLGGTGLGTVNTILTIQRNPSASGCVAWNGGSDVIGSGACPPGITGGDEKTGASQTQTRSIAELGLANAASIRIVMNAAEPNAGGVTVGQLVLRIYDATSGAVLFSGPLASPVVFPTTNPGTGNAGFGFALDAAQAAAAQPAFGNSANRLGLSSTMPATAGGQETFYITNITTALPPPTCPAISLAPATLPNGTVGVAYSQAITGSGGTAPYTVVTSSALPAGLTLTPAGGLTGTLTTAGTFTFSIRITDATGCFVDRSYTLLILNAVPTLPQLFLAFLALSLPAAGYVRLRRRARAM